MQYGAILNYVYNAWTHSVFFAILEKIWRPFKRAYDDLAPVKWLRRGDRIQAVYENSLFARIIRFILDLIEKILSAIAAFSPRRGRQPYCKALPRQLYSEF